MSIRTFMMNLEKQRRTDTKAFVVYIILRLLVTIVLIRSVYLGKYESALICLLALALFYIPPLFERTFRIQIPTLFEIIIYLFIYAAEILGEIDHYYVLIPGWDTMLHTINGFLFAIVGFSLVDLLNRHSERIDLSPLYLTLVAFCFSMTVGVIWEFFEFSMDFFFGKDMQKDFIIQSFGSVTLDPNNMGEVIHVNGIEETVIKTASGETIKIDGGYLDIGIIDTIKDLFVNFLGAIVFSFIGFHYVRTRDKKHRITKSLLLTRDEHIGEDISDDKLADDKHISAEGTDNDATMLQTPPTDSK